MTTVFQCKTDDLSKGLERLTAKMVPTIMQYATFKALQIEADMKMNRPWTDRTMWARLTLTAKASRPDTNTIRITLSHGMYYGIFLELCNEKRYAIIAPTIRKFAPEVVQELGSILGKMT